MKVHIPSALYSYTQGKTAVEADGATLDRLLRELDHRYPGLRFRIVDEQEKLRPHMKIFINGSSIRNLAHPLQPGDAIHLLCALSGG